MLKENKIKIYKKFLASVLVILNITSINIPSLQAISSDEQLKEFKNKSSKESKTSKKTSESLFRKLISVTFGVGVGGIIGVGATHKIVKSLKTIEINSEDQLDLNNLYYSVFDLSDSILKNKCDHLKIIGKIVFDFKKFSDYDSNKLSNIKLKIIEIRRSIFKILSKFEGKNSVCLKTLLKDLDDEKTYLDNFINKEINIIGVLSSLRIDLCDLLKEINTSGSLKEKVILMSTIFILDHYCIEKVKGLPLSYLAKERGMVGEVDNSSIQGQTSSFPKPICFNTNDDISSLHEDLEESQNSCVTSINENLD